MVSNIAMGFKDEISQAAYYKKLGDKAFVSKNFQKAAEHYLKGLQTYPFIAVIRNAKASLERAPNAELANLLANLAIHKKSFLGNKSEGLIEKLGKVSATEIKSDFFKHPYKNYPEVVTQIQIAIGDHFSKTPDAELESLFLYLGKYNPNDARLKPFIQTILDRLSNNEHVENAVFDFTELVRDYGDLIADKLSEFSEQLTSILSSSTEFNERRFSIFALEVLGERDINLIKAALPILYENIKKPLSILEGLQKKIKVLRMPLFEMRMGVKISNPHIWVLDASIATIGSLAKKYAADLEYFIPAIVEQLMRGNLYTKKKCVQALLDFRDAGIDVYKYFPKKKIEDVTKLLYEGGPHD